MTARAETVGPWTRRAVFAAVLLALAVPVHRPALSRYFTSDQILYFREVGGERSLAAGLRLLDYNADRRWQKGDQALYRPLLFALLAAENAAFGRDYRAWNALNLGLHLVVVFALFELLWAIQPGIFAAAFALRFSVFAPGFELVAWSHLGGYLLGFALMLAAFLAARRLEGGGPARAAAYAALMLAAALCYEMGVIASVLVAADLLWRNRGRIDRAAAAALAPPLAYAALYAARLPRVERLFWVDRRVGGAAGDFFPLRVAKTLAGWTLRACESWNAAFAARPVARYAWADGALDSRAAALTAVLLAGALAWSLRAGFARERLRANGRFAALLACLLAAYAAVVCAGRPYALGVTYYLYFFGLVGAVLVYALVDFSRLGLGARTAALALLAVGGAADAAASYAASRATERANAPLNAYFDSLEAFVAAHRGEPGFAFAVRRTPEQEAAVDPDFAVSEGFPTGRPALVLPVSAYVYAPVYDAGLLAGGADPTRHRYLLGAAPER
ncbi:MAG: hypothetical protein HY079_01265 [Elusimicrobia bacterium]|nr:hypothetical protein [Elusimicrobiota bacterium]